MTFSQTLTRAFLVPAVEAADYQERWKAVNRCAGALVGFCFGRAVELYPDPLVEVYPGGVRMTFTQAVAQDCQAILGGCSDALRFARPSPSDRAAVGMILGPNGLQKRVLECLRGMVEAFVASEAAPGGAVGHKPDDYPDDDEVLF